MTTAIKTTVAPAATVNTLTPIAPFGTVQEVQKHMKPKAARKGAPKTKSSNAKGKGKPLAKVLHESKVQSPVTYVHNWCAKHAKGLRRKDALLALAKLGIAQGTAATQFQRWFADPKASAKKYGKAAK